jgi:hypothetical protein
VALRKVPSPDKKCSKCAKPRIPREWQDEPKSVKPDGRAPGLKCPKSTVYLTVPKKQDILKWEKILKKREKNNFL